MLPISTLVFLLPFAAAVLGLLLVLPIVIRLSRRSNAEELTPEWLESFSPSSYYPMQGLLAEDDFRFLSRQPGFDLSLYKKLRRERLLIFRQYANRLILDFNRLHSVALLLLAQCDQDQSKVMSRLMRLKAKFFFAVVQAEMSYALCCFGFRSLAVRAMILRLEEMNAQLSAISAAQFA